MAQPVPCFLYHYQFTMGCFRFLLNNVVKVCICLLFIVHFIAIVSYFAVSINYHDVYHAFVGAIFVRNI